MNKLQLYFDNNNCNVETASCGLFFEAISNEVNVYLAFSLVNTIVGL